MKLDIPRDLAKCITGFWGECTPATVLAACDYACRRKQALAKDKTRHDKGKLPARFYTPRLDNVEAPPRALAAAVESVERVAEKLANGKPEPKRPAKRKPEPVKTNGHRRASGSK